MVYYIAKRSSGRNTAGAKAPDDVQTICKTCGYKAFEMPVFPNGKNKIYQKLWLASVCVASWKKLACVVGEGDVVIYQHPLYGNRVIEKMVPKIRQKCGCKFIAVIHDLESLRGGIQGVVHQASSTSDVADNRVLKCFDTVICHNEHMRRYLIAKGFEAEKLVNLDLFDYLTDCEMPDREHDEDPSVAIAGNLAPGKCSYIYAITNAEGSVNPNLKLHLYGINYDEGRANTQMEYHGSYKPEVLPGVLRGKFGLVWDGTSPETCAGNTGNYLRYNNPHKTSLYLSAGMPVVVWSEAAVADFVRENGVGITVDSLYKLETAVSGVTEEEYAEMCRNVALVAKKLRSGAYLKDALERSMERL